MLPEYVIMYTCSSRPATFALTIKMSTFNIPPLLGTTEPTVPHAAPTELATPETYICGFTSCTTSTFGTTKNHTMDSCAGTATRATSNLGTRTVLLGLGSLFLTFSTARKTFQLRTGAYLNSTNSQILIDTLGVPSSDYAVPQGSILLTLLLS
jgi:hypothetical protein